MAMPSANSMQDKMQFTTGGGDIHRQWFPDERDGFIYWIRGEFAAANAIIDSLCQHLRSIGDPGEYDMVLSCVQQRRFNWNPVLHMQQYFSVAEIVYALQQASWRKQQRYYDNFKPAEKNMKKYSTQHGGFRQRQSVGTVKDSANLGTECYNSYPPKGENSLASGKGELENENIDEDGAKDAVKVDDNISGICVDGKKGGEDDNEFSPSESRSTNSKSGNGTVDSTGEEVQFKHGGCTSNSTDSSSAFIENSLQPVLQNGKQSAPSPKTFCGTEMFDGKTVNVVDGLKLYEGVYDSLEVSRFLTIVNDLRAAGKKGQLQGQTFTASKRPAKGHGREFLQLGVSVVDAPPPPDDECAKVTYFDRKIQPIPAPLQHVIDQLHHTQLMINKPDSCLVDFYNQGDYSQPHIWPPWFGRPSCLLFLTECDMVFGRAISADHHGDYRGALKVSLLPGSVLVMDGKSADFAKHAIPSLCNDCTVITFTKAQARRAETSPTASASAWAHSPNRGPTQQHPAMSTAVLPAPAGSFHHPSVALSPVSSGWPAAPRHHIPVPGTGVFLPPPGSGGSPRPEEKSGPGKRAEEEKGLAGEAEADREERA